jgi:hypothetical protein
MSSNKYSWLVLLIVIAGIRIFSLFPEAVETYYSNGVYPVISRTQRILLGWLPLSIGDLLYATAIIYLIVKLVKIIRIAIRKQADKKFWIRGFRKLAFLLCSIFAVFYLFWGLNYSRLGIEHSLHLKVENYSKDDLLAVVDQLVYRLNELDSTARLNRSSLHKKRDLFGEAYNSYERAKTKHPALTYRSRSVKPSLYSYLGNYLGFTGYYNPFTGEAQVNTTVPVFLQPFTTCHEIGHQLGYAKENEANFAGYLSASASSDPAFRYSVYFDMYLYSRRYLYNIDSNLLKQYDLRIAAGVKQDYKELRRFWKKHENPVEVFVDILYGQYLKANQQPSGKLTYSEVIAWLIAYYKKYGKDAV